MGEKRDLRARLRETENRARSAGLLVNQYADEIRRLRSDIGTLTHRLEQTHAELRDRRAFQAKVAELAGIVSALNQLPSTGTDQQEGTPL